MKKKISLKKDKYSEDNKKCNRSFAYPQNIDEIVLFLKKQNSTYFSEVLYRLILIGIKNYTQDEAFDVYLERDSIVEDFYKREIEKKEKITEQQRIKQEKKNIVTRLWSTKRKG